MPSHRCRIPDSGDAPGRMRPLPFHHQRSPSSSLVNIPQDTSHNPRTRNPCNPHRPQNRVVTQSRYIRSRRHARHVDIRDPPYGAIDSPVLRSHGRALGISDRPAPREPMTKPFLSRDFRLSDRRNSSRSPRRSFTLKSSLWVLKKNSGLSTSDVFYYEHRARRYQFSKAHRLPR